MPRSNPEEFKTAVEKSIRNYPIEESPNHNDKSNNDQKISLLSSLTLKFSPKSVQQTIDFHELMKRELKKHDRKRQGREPSKEHHINIDFHELMKRQLQQHDKNEALKVFQRKKSVNLLEESTEVVEDQDCAVFRKKGSLTSRAGNFEQQIVDQAICIQKISTAPSCASTNVPAAQPSRNTPYSFTAKSTNTTQKSKKYYIKSIKKDKSVSNRDVLQRQRVNQ